MMMQNEVITEIVKRLKVAFAIEKKVRKAWVAAGLPERTAPSSLGLIGTAETGYECTRSAWWHGLDCNSYGLDYIATTREIEKTKIKNLSFGS